MRILPNIYFSTIDNKNRSLKELYQLLLDSKLIDENDGICLAINELLNSSKISYVEWQKISSHLYTQYPSTIFGRIYWGRRLFEKEINADITIKGKKIKHQHIQKLIEMIGE